MRVVAAAALAVGVNVSAAGARAQGAAPAAEPQESQQDELSRRATDPTASPPSFSLINDVTISYRDQPDGTSIDETGYDLRFQPVILSRPGAPPTSCG